MLQIRKMTGYLNFQISGMFLSSFGGFGWGEGFFDNPADVAVDGDRNIYVADTDNDRIQKIDEYGMPIFVVGKKGAGAAEFKNPQGIAVGRKLLYVSDTGNDRIQIFDKRGNFLIAFGKTGSGKGEFNSPAGISIGSEGIIFITDTNNHRIEIFRVTY